MDTCTDDAIFAITLFLSPKDLVNLALVCKRFGGKNTVVASKKKKKSAKHQQQRASERASAAGGEESYPWSMMEESSRRRISSAKNNVNNPYRISDFLSVRRDESWMAVDNRLYQLQHSLVFSTILASRSNISYVNQNITHVQSRRHEAVGFPVAICQEIMTSGKNCAEFIVTQGGSMKVGIIRPCLHDWPKKRLHLGEYRSYWSCRQQRDTDTGINQYFWPDDKRGGMLVQGDIIGMRIDLDDGGTLNVYKNGNCVETMCGLAGHYCWAVNMRNTSACIPSIRVQKAPIPSSPII